MQSQDGLYVKENEYVFARYNNDSDGRSLLLALTNQIKNDVSMTGVKVVGFKANQKICNLVMDPTSQDGDDCLTVSANMTVDISIKAGGLPKIYAIST